MLVTETSTLVVSILIYDTVNHEILLEKLKYYGIKETSNNWFKSYLCERLQYTQIKDSESSLKAVSHGVPQGSILGPLLFIIFINDMYTTVKVVRFITTQMTQTSF